MLFRLLLFFLVMGITHLAQAQDVKPFKIGFIAALSGEGASFGQAVKNGAIMAYESLDAADQKKLELVFEDDQMTPKNTITAFNKLTSINEIDTVVTISSGTSNALAPIAEQRKLPMLAIASDKAICENRKFVMNHWVTPEAEAEIALKEVIKRNYQKIIEITTVQDGALAIKNHFNKVAAGKLQIMMDEEIPYDNRDMRTIIAKIRTRKDVDAVMLSLLPGQLSVVARQLRQYGVKVPLFGFELFEDRSEVEASGGALIGGWYVNASDATSVFDQAFVARYGNDKTKVFASNAYDIVRMISDALKVESSRENVNNHLHTIKDYQGVSGKYSAMNDNRFSLPAAVKMVTPTGFEQLSE